MTSARGPLAAEAQRPILWQAVVPTRNNPEIHRRSLRWIARNRDKGLQIFGQAGTVRSDFAFSLDNWNLYDSVPIAASTPISWPRSSALRPTPSLVCRTREAHTKFFTGGAFTTDFLRWLVRDEQKLTLEEAHYRMSALPAHAVGFRDRGMLREGYAADMVVYNLSPATERPRSTAPLLGHVGRAAREPRLAGRFGACCRGDKPWARKKKSRRVDPSLALRMTGSRRAGEGPVH